MAAYLNIKCSEKPTTAEMQAVTVLGEFSVNKNGALCQDNKKNMNFLRRDFRTVQEKFDLNTGLQQRISKNMDRFLQERENLVLICQWILSNKDILYMGRMSPTVRITPDMIFRRGSLKNILCSPYNESDSWTMNVIKYRGTIYVAVKYGTEERLSRHFNSSMASAYGYKFEHCMRGETGPVDENEEYYCVVETTLGKHRLMIYGEIDGIDYEKYTKHSKVTIDACIELKTNNTLGISWNQAKFVRYKKAMEWWAQSASIGISEIVCGFKDTNGIIRSIEVVQVKDLPNYKSSRGTFDTKVMVQFAVRLMDWLTTVIIKEEPTVYEIKYCPFSKTVTCRISNEQSYITKDYKAKLFSD